MGIRLIHTSDWQIGKTFRSLDEGTMGQVQEARLGAISRIGKLAGEYDARRVLVAGDVYDMEALSPLALNQPLERMRGFPDVTWHLLPGNHDPYRPNGLWDRLIDHGLPENVHAHITAEPVLLEDNLALLPAPLFRRRTLDDPTAWMDEAVTPDGYCRVGIAHGTVKEFGSGNTRTPNYITSERSERAGLAYLALGDWHGQRQINARCWYSGTPETDAFNVMGGGQALLVVIDGPDATPTMTPLPTGHFTWIKVSEQLASRDDIDRLGQQLRALDGSLERVLVQLGVEGTLSLEDLQYFRDQIVEGAAAAFAFMDVDHAKLFSKPTGEDLDRIDLGGFVRKAADELMRIIEKSDGDEREVADAALMRLYLEHMKLQEKRQ